VLSADRPLKQRADSDAASVEIPASAVRSHTE
jgi:hypothetical protein